MSAPTAADTDISPVANRLGRVAVHPVLIAAYPTLALWAANLTEVLPREVWPLLWIPVVATVVVWFGAALAFRDHRRGAILASLAAAAVLNLGRIAGGTSRLVAVAVIGGVAVLAVVLARRLRPTGVAVTTAIVNVLAVVLVAMPLIPIVPRLAPSTSGYVAPASADVRGTGKLRDIWYIVPDRYPRADTLATAMGFDNTPFLSSLEARGFQVADHARANYPKTAHSLSSAWNLDYLQDLVTDTPAGDDWQPLYDMLRDHRLGRILTDAGYEYVHLGSWWGPTASAASADIVRRADNVSEFAQVWRSQTAIPALTGSGRDTGGNESLRELNWKYSNFQFDELDRLAREPHDRPRFVLAHITQPHEPYVFDADGSYVTAEQAASRTHADNFTRQVQNVNRRLEQLLDVILAGPEETDPIVVIQSDEGPHPPGYLRERADYDWVGAPLAEREEKLRVLSAMYLPGTDVQVPDDLTEVNSWRLVLDTYLGTDFGLLPNHVYVYRDESHLYEFHEVTSQFD